MKFVSIASICLAATTAPRLSQAATTNFDGLLSLVSQLQDEATMLATEYGAKDDEIASLISQLARCSEQEPSNDDDEAEQESTPSPKPSPTPESQPTPYPTPSESQPQPQPTPEEMSSSTSTEEPTSAGPVGGDFAFAVGQSWNYNLVTPVDTSADVDIFFIDMDNDQTVIDELHGKGKGVVCYISIGTVEDWRDDNDEFPSSAVGGGVDGWAGEKWLDVNNKQVREIMIARVEMAASMNCDAVEPDNMMVYAEGSNTGVSVSEAQQIEYNSWFADVVHAFGMAVGLKNAVELVPVLVNKFDFALNEECHEWDECDIYGDTFLAEGKPVFNVEYKLGKSVCDEANALGIDTILKNYELDAAFCSCVDPSRDVNCML